MSEFIKTNRVCNRYDRRNTADIEAIRNMSEPEVEQYIRNRLRFDRNIEHSLRYKLGPDESENQHYRFSMDEDYAYNMGILLKFEDLGIFDYYEFLSLRFYKGGGYVTYGNASLGMSFKKQKEQFELNEITDLYSRGTVEIIYEIFKITILMKL